MTTSIGDLLDTLTVPGELYEKLADNTVVCHACGHRCKIREGKRGICQVRFNVGGELRVPHGYVAALQSDPIEKKPFYHVLPSANALTFGMLGCDFHCGYCFTGDTMVVTNRGPIPFQDFELGKSIVKQPDGEISYPVDLKAITCSGGLREQRFGANKYHDNTLVINLGWGVGLGMILNGRLFRGDNGFAGEFSHIPLFTNNKLCECGKTGCLETETSLLVILEKAIKGLEEGRVSMLENLSVDNPETGFEAIIKAANKGDAFATELLSEVGYSIGRGVAVLIHILNPKMVIISG